MVSAIQAGSRRLGDLLRSPYAFSVKLREVRLVSVIGMHRSGTSLVARITNLLGVDFGATAEMLPAAPRNPSGFWENARLVELNDELLDALGGNATTPP